MLFWIDPEDGVLLDMAEDVEGAAEPLIERAREHHHSTGRYTTIARTVWQSPESIESTELDEVEPLVADEESPLDDSGPPAGD